MERKATDILLDLESKIDRLLLHIANMDNNYKIIISRLDQIKNNSVLPSLSGNVSNFSEKLPKLNDVLNKKSTEEIPEFINVSSEEAPVKHNKIRVSQVVKYAKSKNIKQNNVVLASVKIYDSKGKEGGTIVGENRTDQNGRWKIDLSPGEYFVHIVKPASSQKPQIDSYFAINISGDKSSLELDPIG